VYQLLEAGLLEAVDSEPLCISLASIVRRLQAQPPDDAERYASDSIRLGAFVAFDQLVDFDDSRGC
jgi:hypothetical protein